MQIDLTPFLSEINQILAAVLLALVAYGVRWAIAWLKSHAAFLDAQTTAQIGTMLDSALKNGVSFAMAQASAAEKQIPNPTVNSPVVVAAAKYVTDRMQPEMTKLGITPDDIANRVIARLPPAPAN